jgi:hypothetical protein
VGLDLLEPSETPIILILTQFKFSLGTKVDSSESRYS